MSQDSCHGFQPNRIAIATIALTTVLTFASATFAQIPWRSDYETAQRTAREQNAILLVHVYSDNCVPCKMLDARAFQDPTLIDAMRSTVIPVKINADRSPDLVQRLGVNRWPTDVYFSADGYELVRTVSPQKTDDYVQLLNRVSMRNRDYLLTLPPQNTNQAVENRFAQSRNAIPARLASNQYVTPQDGLGTANSYDQNAISAYANKNQPAAMPPIVSSSDQFRQNVNEASLNGHEVENMYCMADQYAPIQPGQAASSAASMSAQTTSIATPTQADPNQGGWRMPTLQTSNNVQANNSQPQLSSRPINTATFQAVTFENRTSQFNTPNGTNVSNNYATTVQQSPQARLVIDEEVRAAIARDNGPAMSGYCPVALDERGEWTVGNPRIPVRHRGRVYHFSSTNAQEKFLANPDRYAPILSGYDLVHFLKTGELRSGLREYGCWFKGRVYLFASASNRQYFDENVVEVARAAETLQASSNDSVARGGQASSDAARMATSSNGLTR